MATRTIGTELKLTGEKEFNQQMKAVNAGLKTTKSDMAALTSSFGDNANSMGNLMKKQKLLRTSVEQHTAKVAALDKQYKAAVKQHGKNSAMAQKYKQDLNNATAALNKETAALEKNADAMKSKYTAALKSLGTGAKKTFSGIGKAASGMGAMVGGAAAASAAGVVAIGAAAGAALLGVANMAKEAAEAAKAAREAGKKLTKSQKEWLEFSKQLDSLSGSFTDAKSAIAELLLPALSDLASKGTVFLTEFTDEMKAAEGDTEKQTQIIGKYLAKGAETIIAELPSYVTAGKEILGGIVAGFEESGPELLDMGLELILDLMQFIMEEAPNLVDAGLELVTQLIEGLDGEELADQAINMVIKISESLSKAAPRLIPAATKLVLELVMGLVKNSGKTLEAGWALLMSIIEGILSGLGEIETVGPEIIQALIDSLKGSDSDVLKWCGDLIETIRQGILDAWNDFVPWFSELWSTLFGDGNVDVGVTGNVDVDGSHAGGLRYVPYDGYLAELHRGEQVLTAQEAAAYRSGQSGKVFNMTINTTSLSTADMDMLVEYMNGKLGEALL